MPRDKKTKERDAKNAKVIDALRKGFPSAQFKELMMIPRISGIIVYDWPYPEYGSRIALVRKALGDLESGTFLRLMTPLEYEWLLEEREHPMD